MAPRNRDLLRCVRELAHAVVAMTSIVKMMVLMRCDRLNGQIFMCLGLLFVSLIVRRYSLFA